MFSSIVSKYNQTHLKLDTLYKLNLYIIDQERYIDIEEVQKYQQWVRQTFHRECTADDATCSNECCENGHRKYPIEMSLYNAQVLTETERKQATELYVERKHCEDRYRSISMDNYLLRTVEQAYQTLDDAFDQYKMHLDNLMDFQKPANTFKQIISPESEIIYVVQFKTHINDCSALAAKADDGMAIRWNIEISIDDMFEISYLFPLKLK